MENKVRNLWSLKAEFHDKGKAIRGKKNILNLINNNKSKEVTHLLRFHDQLNVYGQELIKRFEIDALIEYYNLLLVGVFAGYIPGKFDEDTYSEITTILDHPSVRPYYQEHYKYKMVSLTLQYVKEKRNYNQDGNPTTLSAFNEFISINRILKRDKDLEHFLGMLDYVWYANDNINDVNEILSSARKLNEAFTTKNKTEAQSGVWGFIKYTTFLGQLKELLLTTEQYPLLQSSFWAFHGYYFERMNSQMKEIFNVAFDNLEIALGNPEIFKNIIKELNENDIPEYLNEIELRSFANAAISQSREDVEFILNKKWMNSLSTYFNSNQ